MNIEAIVVITACALLAAGFPLLLLPLFRRPRSARNIKSIVVYNSIGHPTEFNGCLTETR
jgi:hypothetical protein